MSVYRSAWLTVACILAAAGIVLTFVVLPRTAVVDAVIAGAFVGAALTAALRYWLANRAQDTGRQVAVGTRLGVRDVVTAGVVGATVGLALAGSIGLLGPAAFGMDVLTCAALAASSPPAIRRYAGWTAPSHPAPPEPSPPSTVAAPTPPRPKAPAHQPGEDTASLRSLSYAELCRAWQDTYVDLEGTGDAAVRSQLAALRRAYLDEMERRDPAGFTRWLADVGRAAANPAVAPPAPKPRRPRKHDGHDMR